MNLLETLATFSLVWDRWLIKFRLSGLLLRTTSYLNSCAAVTISANHRPLHNCCYANKPLLGSTCILFSHCTIEFHWRNFPYSQQFLLLICIRCTWNMMNIHVSGVTLWVYLIPGIFGGKKSRPHITEVLKTVCTFQEAKLTFKIRIWCWNFSMMYRNILCQYLYSIWLESDFKEARSLIGWSPPPSFQRRYMYA